MPPEEAKPLVHFELDTRSYGPAECETCDLDVEDVILMDDMTFVCPDCGQELELGGDEMQVGYLMAPRMVTPDDIIRMAAGEGGAHICDDDCRSYGCPQGQGRR